MSFTVFKMEELEGEIARDCGTAIILSNNSNNENPPGKLVIFGLCEKDMNREIELHDSTLKEVVVEEAKVTLVFDEAYVHHSEGQPGLDKGTGWAQKISIFLQKASILEIPSDLPNDISDGHLSINGKKLKNMFHLPLKAEGDIEIELLTQYNQKLRATAGKIRTEELSDPKYIEDFPGLNT